MSKSMLRRFFIMFCLVLLAIPLSVTAKSNNPKDPDSTNDVLLKGKPPVFMPGKRLIKFTVKI